jgi:hypothetical protein
MIILDLINRIDKLAGVKTVRLFPAEAVICLGWIAELGYFSRIFFRRMGKRIAR